MYNTPSPASPSDTPRSPWARWPVGIKIASIPFLFLLALIGMQIYSFNAVNRLRDDTAIVDLAARQRVLTQRMAKEVLLVGEGREADWRSSQTVFDETAAALIEGGNPIYSLDTNERRRIDGVEVEEIREQLNRQRQGMRELAQSAETYLRTPVTNRTERSARLEDFLSRTYDLSVLGNTTTKAITSYSVDKINQTQWYQAIVSIVLGVVGVAFSWGIAQNITGPLGQVVVQAQRIGSGDLRARPLPVNTTDELGRLAATFNEMQERLRSVAVQTREATENLNAAAAEILASTQEQAAGSGEQSAAVQETSTTMEEISRSGAQIGDKARQVAATAEQTSAASDAGLAAVQDTNRVMNEIQEQAETVASSIVRLSERTRSVGDIISSVNSIAEQTHLLALNAAIEAAGAGESGRRFGVVADEMKHLADQSREATVQVRSILGEIQRDIHQTVMLTEEAVKRVERGRRQSEIADSTIRQMADSIVQSVNAFQQIVAATNQQQIGFEQVTQATQQIRVALDQATQGTRQLETAALSLNDLAGQLRRAVEVYQL